MKCFWLIREGVVAIVVIVARVCVHVIMNPLTLSNGGPSLSSMPVWCSTRLHGA